MEIRVTEIFKGVRLIHSCNTLDNGLLTLLHREHHKLKKYEELVAEYKKEFEANPMNDKETNGSH